MGGLKDGLGSEIRNSITILDDNKIFFRVSGLFIHSDDDGSLTVSADGAGNSVKIKLSDTAGGSQLSVMDSDGFVMTQLDSDGNVKHKGNVRKTSTN